MILVTHALVGGAIGSLVPSQPILAFFLGFLSHFAADAVPHWHYPLFSLKHNISDPMDNDMLLNKWFIVDIFNIGIDCLAGILLSLIFFHPLISFDVALISVLAGAIGGIAPDALQFLYWKMPNKPLIALQKVHINWAHSKVNIDSRHLLGISTQILFAAAVIWSARWFGAQ